MDHEIKVNNLESRVSRIEIAVESTQNSINTLAQNTERQIAQLASATEGQIDRLSISLEKMIERQQFGQRTNWQVIFSGVSVALAVILSLGGGFVKLPLDRLEGTVTSYISQQQEESKIIRDRLREHDKAIADLIARSDNCQITQSEIRNLPIEHSKFEERLIGIEREIYSDAKYRGTRPQ